MAASAIRAPGANPFSLDTPDPVRALRQQGFALLPAAPLRAACGLEPDAARALDGTWDDLPPDPHLLDGGAYRARRHASYVLDLAAGTLTRAPPRAHWQPTDYNALHGGIERWFEPVLAAVDTIAAWPALLRHLGGLFAQAAGAGVGTPARWYIEAHQFRIDTAQGIGRPTPEGAHRDGVDYVAVILVQRHQVRGGETRVFDTASPLGVRFTLVEPWSALLLDDARVIHETTPIQPAAQAPVDRAAGRPVDRAAGRRDTLVLTYRRDGFQDPPAGAGRP
jgi:hypothetical protein